MSKANEKKKVLDRNMVQGTTWYSDCLHLLSHVWIWTLF